MASISFPEKPSKAGLTVETTQLTQKTSRDTFGSEAMSPSAEKTNTNGRRSSDASTPSSAHHANPFDTDIEAIITTSEQINRKSTQGIRGGTDCQVWPGQDHWRRKAKVAKMKRANCNCLAHMSKRNRLIAKILIGIFIIGAAVAVGFGVSKPLGAGIWHSETQR